MLITIGIQLTQFFVNIFRFVNAIFPISILLPFIFVFALIEAIRLALQEKPYALVGTIAGFTPFVMLSPLIHYGIYGTTQL